MLRRASALSLATILGLGGAIVASAPASAATTWDAFRVDFQNAGVNSITLDADITGTTGVTLPGGKSLVLDLNGYDLTVTSAADGTAAIGVPTGTTLTIRDTAGGGSLTATSTGDFAAGIGTGQYTVPGTVNIQSGAVTANGGWYGAGIGGGIQSSGATVNISGGTVNATAGTYAAGIGGSSSASGGATTITGGTVTAKGGAYGAGIGGGSTTRGGTVSVSGGTVSATGGNYGPGIGATYAGTFGSISLTGGTVVATGGEWSAGLGGGWYADGVPVTIGSAANVTATGNGANAIGNGRNASGFGTFANAGTLTLGFVNGGAQTIPTGADLTNTGRIVNNGTITVEGTLPGDVDNHGTILVREGGTVDPTKVTDHNYLVTFDRDNGDDDSVIRVYAATVSASQQALPATPTRTGYDFLGWTANGAAFTANTTLAGDTTVTASWQRRTQPFTSGLEASISAPKVGTAASVIIDTDAVPAPSGYTYQWLVNGAPVLGATDATFTPTGDLAGQELRVTVTPVLDGYTGGTTTTEGDVIAEGSFTTPLTAAIEGTPAVGVELTADVTAASAPATDAFIYQWFTGETAIDGATSSTYTPTPDTAGTVLSVRVTPVAQGYIGSTGAGTATATSAVVAGSFTDRAAVTLSGTAKVGETLTATVDTASAPAATSYEYRWYANDERIADAAGATFTLTAAELGATISVVALPQLDGYDPASGAGTSAATAAVALGSFTQAAVVEITGTAAAFETLTAVVTTEASPAPTAYTYQWFADGETIDGATKDTYVPTSDDIGYELTVAATPVLAGYTGGTGTSDATDPVDFALQIGTLTVELEGIAQTGHTITAVLGGDVEPAPTEVAYVWATEDELLDEDGPTLALTDDLVGEEVTVLVIAAADGYFPMFAVADPVTVAAAPTISLSIDTATAGDSIVVAGTGFFGAGDLTVELHSDPVVLGTITPAVDGSFRGEFSVPANTPAGEHTVVVRATDGTVLATSPLIVTAAADGTDGVGTPEHGDTEGTPAAGGSTPDRLGATGGAFDGTSVALLALGVLVAGAILRRRATRNA